MSMGVLILQGADKRYVSPNTFLMLHDGEDGYSGHTRNFERWADHSKELRKLSYRILAERSGKEASYWERTMLLDKILTAEKAVREGLADGIWLPDGSIVTLKDLEPST